MDLDPDKRDDAADEISGYQVGSGYYAQRISYDEARDIVASVFPVIAEHVARATADAIADKIEAEARQTGEAIRRETHEFSAALVHREAFGLNLAANIARAHGRTPETDTTEATE